MNGSELKMNELVIKRKGVPFEINMPLINQKKVFRFHYMLY
jgi:hypothetical protein